MTYPHFVLVGPTADLVGKMTGVPVALTVILRPGVPDAFERTIANRVFHTDVTDYAALLETTRQINAWRPVDAMCAATEHALLPTAAVAEAIGARSNPVSAIQRTQDKSAMRECLAANGLTVVEHRICAGPAQVREFLAEFPAGVILKPVNGNGSRGISRVRDPEEVAAAFHHTVAESDDDTVLAERFIEGIETSAETMSAGGEHLVLAVPTKHTSGSPHYVEVAHQIPGDHPDDLVALVSEAAVAALTAIGLKWGPTNTEIKVEGDRAAIIEINPRFGGAQYVEMIELATGVDQTRATAMSLCYGELPTPRVASPGQAIKMLTPERPGRVVSITGTDHASAVDGVVRVGELPALGVVVPPLTDYKGRTGYVLASGESPAAALATAQQAAQLVRIHTVPAADDAEAGASLAGDMRQAVQAVLPDARKDLETLVRIPSISGDPAHADDVRRAAELCLSLLKDAGAEEARLIEAPGGKPAVFAHFPAPPEMPTLLLYGHHDVRPVDDPGAWASRPFEPTEREGRLYGRGAADGKAAIAAHLSALRVFAGHPPIGVKVLLEGEEAIGSATLGALLAAHRDELAADAVLFADPVLFTDGVTSANAQLGVLAATTPKTDVIKAVEAAFGAAYETEPRRLGPGDNTSGGRPAVAGFAEAFPGTSLLVITSAGADAPAADQRPLTHSADEGLNLAGFLNACLAEALLLTEIARRNDKAPAPIVI